MLAWLASLRDDSFWGGGERPFWAQMMHSGADFEAGRVHHRNGGNGTSVNSAASLVRTFSQAGGGEGVGRGGGRAI